MFDFIKKIKTPEAIISFVLFVWCIVYPCYKAEIAKDVYRNDLDIQYEQMYKYRIVPIEGIIQDRLGGNYFSILKYGELSDNQIDLLADDLKNDGFIFLPDLKNEIVYCKDKIAVEIFRTQEEGEIRILLRRNYYNNEKNLKM